MSVFLANVLAVLFFGLFWYLMGRQHGRQDAILSLAEKINEAKQKEISDLDARRAAALKQYEDARAADAPIIVVKTPDGTTH